MRKISTILGSALVATVLGCQELAVTNPNDPNREQATGQPAAVEALVSSAFSLWWFVTHDDEPGWGVSTMADEFSGTFLDFGLHHSSQEPRQAWINTPTFTYNNMTETPWYNLHSVVSNVNDALVAMNGGVVPADAARARAVAKFMQGLSHGYLALYFDSAFVVTELVDLDTVTVPRLQPYSIVMDTALSELRQAITIAEANVFTIPGPPGWFRTPVTNTELVRLAHSFIARFLISEPRDRAERDAVDWSLVLAHAEQGIQTDFTVEGEPGVLENGFTFRAARKRTTTPSDFARPDMWLLGPADSATGFLAWVNTPVENRHAFRDAIQLRTKDRRIHGSAGPSTQGRYFGYHRFAVGDATRGTYHYSNYAFYRLGTTTTWQTGPQLAMTTAEMDFIRAEALIRLNRAAEAVPLINKTRVANGELPPVSDSGPPDEPGCVPRKYMPGPNQGMCGSLWDALRYEKRIEMAGVEPAVAYFDARGWQTLVEGTFIQFPVPGRELETLLRPLYTYGGGLAASAPAPDPERCPVPLPRCP